MNKKTLSKKGTVTAMVAVALLLGIAGGNILQVASANAQTTNATVTTAPSTASQSSTQQDQQPPQSGQFDPSKGGHTANGITEQVLTGDTADKAKAAALKSVPGGTVVRAETDADGAKYEVHMTKSDGSIVTVKLDSNFSVTSVEDGMR